VSKHNIISVTPVPLPEGGFAALVSFLLHHGKEGTRTYMYMPGKGGAGAILAGDDPSKYPGVRVS
jgi:hypothetical protein